MFVGGREREFRVLAAGPWFRVLAAGPWFRVLAAGPWFGADGVGRMVWAQVAIASLTGVHMHMGLLS